MTYDDIRSIIEKRLANEFAKSPNYEISWENVDFTPPNNTIWLQAFLRYGDSAYMTMLSPSSSGMDRQNGTLTINVFSPVGTGMASNLTVCARVKSLFNRVNLSDGIRFDAASGPNIVTPSQPPSFIQNQLTVTFEAYINS